MQETYQSKRQQGKVDLVIPIYLDVNALLDLLASVEDGFAVAEKITTRDSTGSTGESSIGTEFGIANILNLLKISLSTSKGKKRTEESDEEHSLVRYHTYGSLLYRLRSNLLEMNLLKSFAENETDWMELKPSDFVELQGIFRPNPLVNSLSIIERMSGISLLFGQTQLEASPKNERNTARNKLKQIESVRKNISGIRSDLEQEDIRIFIVDLTDNSEYKAVVPLFSEYLRDRTMTELTRGEFRLLGKIVRNTSEEGEAIDLLRGTGLGGVSDEIIEKLLAGIEKMKLEGFKLPEVETKVNAPALQIIPIAIYV